MNKLVMNESKVNHIFFHMGIEDHKEVCFDENCIPLQSPQVSWEFNSMTV